RQPEDEESEVVERLAGIYWPLVTAIFLGYSFITADWGRSWFIWPIAAMIFAALSGVVDFRNQKNE
ncbi:MAG: helix-turn-helix domain-containing protein, partial [Ruoffia tabacinasalis]